MPPICLLTGVILVELKNGQTNTPTKLKINNNTTVVTRKKGAILRHHSRLQIGRLRSLPRLLTDQLRIVHFHMGSSALLVDHVIDALDRIVSREGECLPARPFLWRPRFRLRVNLEECVLVVRPLSIQLSFSLRLNPFFASLR